MNFSFFERTENRFQFPRKTAKKASSEISGMLNYIGARLIGLE